MSEVPLQVPGMVLLEGLMSDDGVIPNMIEGLLPDDGVIPSIA